MRKVLLFSTLLLLGLLISQWLPGVVGSAYATIGDIIRILTMAGLSFIMIRVGYEFDIEKSSLKQYGWDYAVAFTAASFPWVFVTLYFVFVLLPPDVWISLDTWKETLLAGRFAPGRPLSTEPPTPRGAPGRRQRAPHRQSEPAPSRRQTRGWVTCGNPAIGRRPGFLRR